MAEQHKNTKYCKKKGKNIKK